MASNTTTNSYKIGGMIGSGGYANVYRGTHVSGQVVALKKSRVSLKVKRPHLKYEARIMQLLQGHPCIATIYGYGRFEHFEHIAMELLGSSLAQMVRSKNGLSLRTTLLVARQMLGALEYLHSHDIIHRDIKPGNMLLSVGNTSQIRLIDFGIARYHIQGEPSKYDSAAEHKTIVGSLDWASLNSHYRIDLSCRDDLESLAFTLIFLLLGDLPWRSHISSEDTASGAIARVREKKKAWPGARLIQNQPSEFGKLLDYARGLTFHEHPDYRQLQAKFDELFVSSGFEGDKIDWTDSSDTRPPGVRTDGDFPPAPCVVTPGQIVSVEILARTTIEGYAEHAGDASFWHDPTLETSEWSFPRRPGIVLETKWDASKKRYFVDVVPLIRGRPGLAKAKGIVSIFIASNPSPDLQSVIPRPSWPLSDVYVYAYPRAEKFVCYPDQTEPIIPHWTISPADTQSLLQKFRQVPPSFTGPQRLDEFEVREYGRLREHGIYNVYTIFAPLQPADLHESPNSGLSWTGQRGWFEELTKISKRRSADDGWGWTVTGHPSDDEDGEHSDSYFAWDIGEWDNRQQERERSLSLDPKETAFLDAKIQTISDVQFAR